MPLILALGRQRQEELCKFEASLVNIASSRTARAIQKTKKKGRGGRTEGRRERERIKRSCEATDRLGQRTHFPCPGLNNQRHGVGSPGV